jgi:putative transposase
VVTIKEEALVANSTNEQSAEQQRRIEIPWVDILQDAEAGLLALSVRTGLKVLQQMMAAEVDEVAGPKGQHNPARQAVRHGTEAGSVMLGDRKIPVTHPRVRTADGQTEIP